MKAIALLMLTLSFAGGALAEPCIEGNKVHACYDGASRVDDCEAAVAGDPLDFEARLALCQAYYRITDYQKALQVVRAGLDRCRGTRDVCRRLARAEDNVAEVLQKESDSKRMENLMEISAARQYCLGPITNSRAIRQCELAAAAQPDDTEVLIALARKLGEQSRPAEGLMTLEKIASFNGSGDYASLKADLERERQQLVDKCLSGDSLEDCASAYLAGASDALDIDLKRFAILSELGKHRESLDLLSGLQQEYPDSNRVADLAYGLDPKPYAPFRADLDRIKQRAASTLGIDLRERGVDPANVAMGDERTRSSGVEAKEGQTTRQEDTSPRTNGDQRIRTAGMSDVETAEQMRTFSNELTADGRSY